MRLFTESCILYSCGHTFMWTDVRVVQHQHHAHIRVIAVRLVDDLESMSSGSAPAQAVHFLTLNDWQ